jgi:hypothetical protein
MTKVTSYNESETVQEGGITLTTKISGFSAGGFVEHTCSTTILVDLNYVEYDDDDGDDDDEDDGVYGLGGLDETPDCDCAFCRPDLNEEFRSEPDVTVGNASLEDLEKLIDQFRAVFGEDMEVQGFVVEEDGTRTEIAPKRIPFGLNPGRLG